MSTSETESEPEQNIPPENVSSLAAFVQLATKQSQDDTAQRPISWAIETLATLDFRLVRKDTTLHPGIQNCATTILGFFDTLLQQDLVISATLISDIASVFKPSFLHLLFQYRRLFYAIAMRDLHPGSAPPAVVCWVDVVLAKLGDVAAFVAAGLHDDPSDEEELSSVLKAKRQEDNLRAATQLPDNWDMVPSMLLSERVSAAAKRLSLRLILGRYILHPSLSGKVIDRSVQKLLSTFSEFVRQTVRRLEDSSSISGPNVLYLIQQERFTCAMAISLLAAAEMAEDPDSSVASESTFRPHTTAAAMQLLQFILHGNASHARAEPLLPLAHLDTATSVIIRWGVVPQWTWSVWSEYRGVHADTIASLTTTYIQHYRLGSGTSLTAGDLAPADVSSRSQGTAIGFMVRQELILRFSLLLSTSAHPSHLPTTLMDVLHEICGFVAQWMNLNTCGIRKSTECCKALIILFCYLSRMEQSASLKDRVLESLALTRPQCMRDAWEAAGGDTKFRVFGALDQAFGQITQILLQGDPPGCGKAPAAQLMQFLLVLMSKGITLPTLEVISTFMETVWGRVLDSDPDESAFLRETLLACLAASKLFATGFEFHKFADVETLWQAGICGGSENLFLACAFALYVCSLPPKFEPLTYLEGLEHLLDTTLLICSRHYLCDDEPLGLIVLPVICDALLHLLEHEDDAVGMHIGSNGRLAVLGDALRSLLAKEGPTNDGYQAMLRNRLSTDPSRMASLLSEAGVHDEQVTTKSSLELEKRGYELLFYRSETEGLSHLMLVPERLDKQ